MNVRALIIAGILIGNGMGSFLDSILFHHNMAPVDLILYPAYISNIHKHVVLQLFTWIITLIGLSILWNAGKVRNGAWSGQCFWGALVIGWGIFNLMESILDQFIFQIHHITSPEIFSYNNIILIISIMLIITGVLLIRKGLEYVAFEQVLNKYHFNR